MKYPYHDIPRLVSFLFFKVLFYTLLLLSLSFLCEYFVVVCILLGVNVDTSIWDDPHQVRRPPIRIV